MPDQKNPSDGDQQTYLLSLVAPASLHAPPAVKPR